MTEKLIAIIERPDGTTYEQEIEFVKDVRTSVRQAQKMIGRDYLICDTYWEY